MTLRHLALMFISSTFLNLAAAQVNPILPMADLSINNHKLKAEVAATDKTRQVGMMNRLSIAPDTGMLFIFDQAQPLAMWMQNTHVPLAVAFIDSKGKILNIEEMEPRTTNSHPSAGSGLYALEMASGWFKTKGIKAGDTIVGLEKAAKLK
jgi:uncharacterized protein